MSAAGPPPPKRARGSGAGESGRSSAAPSARGSGGGRRGSGAEEEFRCSVGDVAAFAAGVHALQGCGGGRTAAVGITPGGNLAVGVRDPCGVAAASLELRIVEPQPPPGRPPALVDIGRLLRALRILILPPLHATGGAAATQKEERRAAVVSVTERELIVAHSSCRVRVDRLAPDGSPVAPEAATAPAAGYDVELTVSGRRLKKALYRLCDCGGAVTVGAEPGRAWLSADGADGGMAVEVELAKGAEVNTKAPLRRRFPLQRLLPLQRAAGHVALVLLQLGRDGPLVLELMLDGEAGVFRLLAAAYVDNPEEAFQSRSGSASSSG